MRDEGIEVLLVCNIGATSIAIDYDTLFYSVDTFCEGFKRWYKSHVLCMKKKRCRQGYLKLSEVITLLIAYHQSGMACFKYYYLSVYQEGRYLFSPMPHYARFVALLERAFPAMMCFLESLQGQITEYLFIDATPMPVCHIKSQGGHRIFKELRALSKTSVGYFFNFKLHVLLNIQGEIVRLAILGIPMIENPSKPCSQT